MSLMKEIRVPARSCDRRCISRKSDWDLRGKRERLGDHAFENAVMIEHEKPRHRLAVLDLLPQPAAVGSAARTADPTASSSARPANNGNANRSLDIAVRIVTT